MPIQYFRSIPVSRTLTFVLCTRHPRYCQQRPNSFCRGSEIFVNPAWSVILAHYHFDVALLSPWSVSYALLAIWILFDLVLFFFATSLGFWRNHLLEFCGLGIKSFLSLVAFLAQEGGEGHIQPLASRKLLPHVSTHELQTFLVNWVADNEWMMCWVLPRGLDLFTLFTVQQRCICSSSLLQH